MARLRREIVVDDQGFITAETLGDIARSFPPDASIGKISITNYGGGNILKVEATWD